MKQISKAKVLAAVMCLAMVFTAVSPVSLPVYADSRDEAQNGAKLVDGGGGSNQNLPDIITTIINVMLFIAAALAVIMIIYGGIRYITAHGDEKQVKVAKDTIVYSVAGLIIAILAYALVTFIFDRFK
ncbi:pilin [Candidatus Nanoperiomorbus periodonticus]|jgi:hypothetical protein cdivTM_30108|uniref:pilin n=1 Tax=Candidatus Nanoperiomorbus periodonticus TaxID=2171989 RepID=UPI00101CEC56|nr:pilin [Candidatus Nanoperiomorbus periodonticus]RYC75351.1 hypothetical protein G52EAM_00578 [Candidatus Nanoperiomorbus periodonticus]